MIYSPPARVKPQNCFQFILVFLVVLALLMRFGCLRAVAQRPMGTDVSSYQSASLNWASLKSNGIAFAWAKATEGLTVNDSDYTTFQANAKAAGVLIGSYHFAHPELHIGPAGADQEAAHFWNIASNYIKSGGAYLMPTLDSETFTNIYDKASLSQWMHRWCDDIIAYAAAQNVTVKPVIYMSTSHANTWLDNTMTNFIPWFAQWPASPDPQIDAPASTAPWGYWTFWQYDDTNAFSQGDSDVFNGTMATLTNTFVIVTNTSPPAITSQPSDRYADRGTAITFRSAATGAGALKYQWRFNGTNIAGATTTAYTLSNIQTNNAGDYAVVVTNLFGAVTSSAATLTVFGPFTPVFSDNFDTNSGPNWTLSQSSADTRIVFAYNYSGYGIPSAPSSTGGTTKGVRFEANISQTNVAALSISPNGQSFIGNYRLHYDLWMNANGPFPEGGTGSTQHQTSGLGTAGNRVQWNTGTADGVWFAVDGEGQASDTSATLPDWRVYVGTTLQAATTGDYVAGNTAGARGNNHPYYENVFPALRTAPAAQGLQVGGLDVGTIGFAWRNVIVNKTGSTVEWFIDGLKIATVTNVTFTSSNIFIGYWDSFASLSDDTNLTFAIVDNVRVEVPVAAPGIIAQPQPLAVTQASNATFTVVGTGAPAPAYQWRFGATNISGATASSFTRNNAQLADAGNYSVVLTNIGGAITSSFAALTVNVPPSISAQPQSIAVKLTSNATFTVSATASPAPGYQWRFNSVPISGATGSSYTRFNIETNDVGNYSVLVTNIAGSIASSDAELSLIPPQPSQFQLVSLLPDGTLKLVFGGEPGLAYTIEISTNLADWAVFTNLVNTNGTVEINAGQTADYAQRFFRTRLNQ
jgi:GH25 family lysozyme M1 (1,4-beta-N-acetylmuramidase)